MKQFNQELENLQNMTSSHTPCDNDPAFELDLKLLDEEDARNRRFCGAQRATASMARGVLLLLRIAD